jgi:hypothetical protein
MQIKINAGFIICFFCFAQQHLGGKNQLKITRKNLTEKNQGNYYLRKKTS